MKTSSLTIPQPWSFPPVATHWTRHAKRRAATRGIAADVVDLVLAYGRTVYTRGAAVHAVGRKEVQHAREFGVDLVRFRGVHVVCSGSGGPILTVYRNENFKGLRPCRRCRSARR